MPACFTAVPGYFTVIPDSQFVIPDPDQVRGFNIRDPVLRKHWIADQVRNDESGLGMTPAFLRSDALRWSSPWPRVSSTS